VLSILEENQHDEQAKTDMQEAFHNLKNTVQTMLGKAKKAGELSPDLDAGSMATTIVTTMSGMMVLGKANFTKTALKKTINQVVSLLD
jgi:hypothetical protein